jgi:hypothetical protein
VRASGRLFAPAVLTGVTPAMRLPARRCPAVCAPPCREEAAIAARTTPTSAGALVWTTDRFKGARIARELAVGMVWMNDHLVSRSAPQLPWGGVGGSGFGRARGAIALRTCAEPKVVTWDPPAGRPFFWFPYDATQVRAARAISELRSARDADRERALKGGGLPLARVAGRTLRTLRRR